MTDEERFPILAEMRELYPPERRKAMMAEWGLPDPDPDSRADLNLFYALKDLRTMVWKARIAGATPEQIDLAVHKGCEQALPEGRPAPRAG